LRELTADILFLGVDGFDSKMGLSTPNLLEAKVNKVMVEIARKVIAVCDSSKFGRRAMSTIIPVSKVHHVITDKHLPKPDLMNLKDAGVAVTLV
jgi:DeoR family transcriptional regulator of aga operon